MSGRIAFAVASGSYSDYRLHAIFESREEAEAHARHMMSADEWRHDARVETIHYFPAGSTAPKRVTKYFGSVTFWDDGFVGDDSRHPKRDLIHRQDDEWDYDAPGDARPRLRFVRAPCHNNKAGRLDVEGLDRNAIVQCLSDRIAMFKAGAWNPNARGGEWTDVCDAPPHARGGGGA